MFFFLSKTLNYLTMPLLILCAFFLLAAFLRSKRWKKRCFQFGLFLLLFWSNDFIANELMHDWEVPATRLDKIKKKYSWGIILTGVTRHETGPPDRIYFQRSADRVTHTLQLYKLGLVSKILISGGSGRLIDIGVKEADEIASVLEMMGVKQEDIVVENESRNTHESAVRVKSILHGKTTAVDCLLITSGYHMRRASACFARVGWPMDSFSTDFLSHDRKFTVDVLLIPKLEALSNWQVLIKEWVGCIAYRVAGYI
jgi:uncharacterized SAM-binding protein YcdF (DUF218 family)